MLKKAGIVVAGAAATLLAVSPLAFAGDKGGDDHHGHHHSSSATNNNGKSSKGGLLNVSDNQLVVPIQACNNDVPIQGGLGQLQVPVKEVTGALSGALALFGTADSDVVQTTDNSRECGDNTGTAGDNFDQDVD
ncbi:hypothetical protein ACQEVB_03275 [Pseudonocardia sp. CA-107938]|uniref:hypothetical protein n=1 Tax=Pseudonocardia sp. CA-107938 TaxID=3240021 RepID=UPI003D8D10BE